MKRVVKWSFVSPTDPVVPKYYYVHRDQVNMERAEPGSQVSVSQYYVLCYKFLDYTVSSIGLKSYILSFLNITN